MSKSEVLYVKGMDLSDSEDANDQNVWDDRPLTAAYDRAIAMARTEVAQRLAMATNSKVKDEKNTKTSQSNNIKTKQSKRNSKWAVGMPCRAIYEGDGLEYEAILVRIINDRECVARFVGYDNSEIVQLKSLKPSEGSEARNMQLEQALLEKIDDGVLSSSTVQDKMEFGSDLDLASGGSTVIMSPSDQRKRKASKKKKASTSSHCGLKFPQIQLPNMPSNMNAMEMPLPPPPLHLPSGADTEDQAVSSMLLSWYMSGYYTGFYQGMKRAKENRRFNRES